MIKHQEKAVEHTPATVRGDSYIVVRDMVATDVADTMRQRNHYDRYIVQEREHVTRLMANISRNLVAKKELEDTIKNYNWTQAEQTAKGHIDRIARYPFIETVGARGNDLYIKTKLIFTQVRINEDSRDTKRRCIGAFAIRINTLTQSISIKNLLFPRHAYQHWSIDYNGRPCLGDWSEEIRDYQSRGDISALVQVLYPYITSTNDGSAYCRSNWWADQRANRLLVGRIRKGGYVMATNDVYTNCDYETDDYGERDYNNPIEEMRIPRGTKGIVQETDRNYARVLWDIPVSYPEEEGGDGEEGREWYTEKRYLIPLLKAQYQDTGLQTPDQLNMLDMDRLDQLPEGSTLSDAKKTLGIK